MATKIKFNIKHGTLDNLAEQKVEDGVLYVATKDDNRAELHVDLNQQRYVISESTQVDDELDSDSENPVQNRVIYNELAKMQTDLGAHTTHAYATCSTAGGTATKAITIQGDVAWDLKTGSVITILFSNTNTASNPQFKVGNNAAKNVYYGANRISTTQDELKYAGFANRPMNFIYDGTQFRFIGWGADEDHNNYVKQTALSSTSNVEYPVITGPNNATTEQTTTVAKDGNFTYNPSTKTVTVANLKGKATNAAQADNAATADFATNADSARSATEAATANKLSTDDKGNAKKPVYFKDGVPVEADAYSSLLTTATSEKAKNFSITVGGTTKDIADLWASKLDSSSLDSGAAQIVGIDTNGNIKTISGFTFDPEKKIVGNIEGVVNGHNQASMNRLAYLANFTGTTVQDELNKKASTDTATTSAAGLMSKEDKAKLDKIANEATKVIVDSSLNPNSSNAISNQIVASQFTTITNEIAELQECLEGEISTTDIATRDYFAKQLSAAQKALEERDEDYLETANAQMTTAVGAAETRVTEIANNAVALAQSNLKSSQDYTDEVIEELTTTLTTNILTEANSKADEKDAALKNTILGTGGTKTTLKALEDYVKTEISDVKTQIPEAGTDYVSSKGGSISGSLTVSGTVTATSFTGNASSASKLANADLGSATQPVYFKNGVPQLANAYSTIAEPLQEAIEGIEDQVSTFTTELGNKASTTALDGHINAKDNTVSIHVTAAEKTAWNNKANNSHISETATGTKFSHVKLSDEITSTSTASDGIAATPKAVSDVNDKVTSVSNRVSTLETGISKVYTKAEIDNKKFQTEAKAATDLAAAKAYTEEYTDAAISGLIGQAPDILDTLEELANALNNDDDAVATLFSELGEVTSTVNTHTETLTAYNGRLGSLEANDLLQDQQLAIIEEDIENLTSRVASNEEAIDNHSDSLTTLSTDIQSVGTRVGTLESNSATKANITTLTEIINTVNQNIEQYKTSNNAAVNAKVSNSTYEQDWSNHIANEHGTINTLLGQKASAADLTTHIGKTDEHVSTTEKETWNNKAPKNHAHSDTTYGAGTGSSYGHVKLSDTASDTSASDSVAATPKAVKSVLDKVTALETAGYITAASLTGYATTSYVTSAVNTAKSSLSAEIDGDVKAASDALDTKITNLSTQHTTDITSLTTELGAVSTVANFAKDNLIYHDDIVLVDSNVKINAQTLEGLTVSEIIKAAQGDSDEFVVGTVGFTGSSDNVTLTNISTGATIYPKTTMGQVDGLSTRLSTIETATNKISGIETSISTINSSISDIGTIRSQVNTNKTDIGTLKSSSSTLTSKVSTLESATATLKTNVSSLTTSVNSLTSTVNGCVKFVKSTTAPTAAVGTIWFDGSSGKCTIKIYNGSSWEVLNSWQ